MNHTDQRRRLRAVLAGSTCVLPASVYDPLSARVAEAVGHEIGLLTGAVASHTTLAAPDLAVLTLTEFADQIRRIMRVSKLSLIVDADHGYGNALNVRRTIQELEHAGVSALSIEDTVLPQRFGRPEGAKELISTEEMVGKLRAAVDARQDPTLVIAGRTSFRMEDAERIAARALAYAATGIDAIFIVGVANLKQIEAIHAAVKLPIIVGPAPASLKRDELAARGARVLLQGHLQPVAAAVKALHETYAHLFNAGAAADLESKITSVEEMERLVDTDSHKKWQREYLR